MPTPKGSKFAYPGKRFRPQPRTLKRLPNIDVRLDGGTFTSIHTFHESDSAGSFCVMYLDPDLDYTYPEGIASTSEGLLQRGTPGKRKRKWL